MKRVYEVTWQHKQYPNDTHKPWVVARSAQEAQRKSRKYIKTIKLPATQMRVDGVRMVGTIEVE